MAEKWEYLDAHLRLRLADLEPRMFEEFFLHFLRAGISLTIKRNSQKLTRRIISADLYAAGSGRDQKGIDLRVEVEGGEIWGFQCKRHKTWNPSQTITAIEEARKFPAQHYFLAVACDPHEGVQDEMDKHPNWTFWNLSTICVEFREQVKPSDHAKALFFLPPEELKRFVPFTTESLIPPEKYFERFLGADKLFRHDWKLVGREKELRELRDFLKGQRIVQVISAKGGEGKSRLVWELCQILRQEMPDVEILCLNPHRTDNEFPFALLGNSTQRIIIVDDAHRTEQVPLQLLAAVAQDAKTRNTKIILATRRQGIEALSHKLYETGLSNQLAPLISLAQLKKSQFKALATESLGKDLAHFATDLAVLTKDSPFLTVVAGDLLRQKRLIWHQWSNNDEFRQQVFRVFEHWNLETIPELDQEMSKGLLRMLALLAPVSLEQKFVETAARHLDCTIHKFESHLSRLRQSELVAGGDDGLRIVPDLFADFLVYDACYEPMRKMPVFVRQILREFSDCSPALIRNLSEATWLARTSNVSGDELLKPLVDQEYLRYEGACNYDRSQILKHWSHFSYYLPKESLDLARLAVGLKPASDDGKYVQFPIAIPESIDSLDYVYRQLTTLLKPVAKYHHDYRHHALDFLWNLGLARNWERNQDHPWEAIAEVIKFEPNKPVEITVHALNWLDSRLKSPSGVKVLESQRSVLRLLLGSCFSRIVEWTWDEGRTVHFCKQAVSAENTVTIRDHAFRILRWVIENGSWLAALDGLSALFPAIERITLRDYQNETEIPKLTEIWRSERLKALALYETAICRQTHFVVRYEIRRTLKRVLAYEKDNVLAKEARRVCNGIANDLALQTAVALLSQGDYCEFAEEMDVPRKLEDYDKVQSLWSKRVRQTATGLAAVFPEPQRLYEFLRQTVDELVQAGYHPGPHMLFSGLAEAAPELAVRLASEIIGASVQTRLAHVWPALLDNNAAASDAKQIELFRMATQATLAGTSSAVIRALAWKVRQDLPLSDEGRNLLLEIAVKANQEESSSLLELVAWCSNANMPLAIQILEALPIQQVAPKMLEQVLLALMPYHDRPIPLPSAVVRLVIMQLIDVADLNISEHAREWDGLINQHSRLVFDLMVARIARSDSTNSSEIYLPVPSNFEGRLNLPGLAQELDYPKICSDLWGHVLNIEAPNHFYWVRLFQAIVLGNPLFWLDRMAHEIEKTTTEAMLLVLAGLLRFGGSLIIFRFPHLTRAFLTKARALGGQKFYEKMRSGLYTGCGPQLRAFSNGVLDKNLDYVEAEAAKAAEVHTADELLGPFYRWIVEIEQKDRLMNKMVNESQMAALD